MSISLCGKLLSSNLDSKQKFLCLFDLCFFRNLFVWYDYLMTTYILAGGNDQRIAGYPTILKSVLPKNLSEFSVLSCFFSRPEREWEDSAADWSTWLSQNLGINSHDYAKFDNFEEKLQKADVVYFHGGDSWLLLESLSEYEDFGRKLNGKIVIGSSAGANMLSNNFWSATSQKAGKGFAIIDVNIMVHYGAKMIGGIIRSRDDWSAEERAFSKVIQSTDIIHLPEGTLKVFSKN